MRGGRPALRGGRPALQLPLADRTNVSLRLGPRADGHHNLQRHVPRHAFRQGYDERAGCAAHTVSRPGHLHFAARVAAAGESGTARSAGKDDAARNASARFDASNGVIDTVRSSPTSDARIPVLAMVDTSRSTIAAAITAPRIAFNEPHHLEVESGIPEPVRSALAAMGHKVRRRTLGNANGLTIGGTLIGARLAREIVTTFLTTEFGGDRHARRVAMIDALDRP